MSGREVLSWSVGRVLLVPDKHLNPNFQGIILARRNTLCRQLIIDGFHTLARAHVFFFLFFPLHRGYPGFPSLDRYFPPSFHQHVRRQTGGGRKRKKERGKGNVRKLGECELFGMGGFAGSRTHE